MTITTEICETSLSANGCLYPPDPLESLMTANQMHIHTLINQLAANGYTYCTQNTEDHYETLIVSTLPKTLFWPNEEDRRLLTTKKQQPPAFMKS